ncbi:hypothetical protein Fmac_016602 [Flemingia macrophylla]|uniref:Uncharacterized protein n=1 Tax=Flemingia macrophylla TaxID=520843 RepID=A0ABD1MI00_9FABA
MGVLVNSMSALSIFHPDANPALKISNKNCWQHPDQVRWCLIMPFVFFIISNTRFAFHGTRPNHITGGKPNDPFSRILHPTRVLKVYSVFHQSSLRHLCEVREISKGGIVHLVSSFCDPWLLTGNLAIALRKVKLLNPSLHGDGFKRYEMHYEAKLGTDSQKKDQQVPKSRKRVGK